ncbi:MAG TPA: ABC transporter permease [Terriglobales bacterium]|nr:ABC transporter permease [Terriglobales bacterium]
MKKLRALLLRCAGLFRKERRDRELAEELEGHLRMHIADNLCAGMTPEEARRQALIKLGGLEQTKENCRERRGLPRLETLLQDVRFGMRVLRKNPGFTAVAVITLALGIGANTAVFSVMNALFLHPPGIRHPDRLVALRVKYDKLGLKNIVVSAPDFAQVRDSKKIFAAAAIVDTDDDFNYTADAFPERLRGAKVSSGWFDVLEAKPMLGRVFVPEEDQPNANHEVVLSYGAWQRWFGANRSVIGRQIQLNEEPYKIIGVMGPEFHWPDPQTDLWAPLALPPGDFDINNTFNENYLAVARLQPGISFSQANAYTRILTERVMANPAAGFAKNAGWGMFLTPLMDFVFGDLRAPVLILSGAVALVLLIACANIAGLLLAKGAGRSKEVAVRAALGASRGRLIAQALAENAILGVAGILLGLFAADYGIKALLIAAPKSLLPGAAVRLDGHVLLFTAVIGIVTVIVFGAIAAWHMSRIDPYNALQESGRSATGSRSRQQFRSFLVAGEMALGLVLLVGTGLLLQSLARIGEVNPGFQPRGIMTAALALPQSEYNTPQKRSAFFSSVLDHLSHTPGISFAGAGLPLPFTGGNESGSFQIEGQPTAPGSPGPHGDVRYVTRGFFTALGIPLLKGRIFTDDDRIGSEPVVVIDENLAAQYWPNQDPIGQKITRKGRLDQKPQGATVVGVVGHIRFNRLAGEESSSGGTQSSSKGAYYFSLYQQPAPYGFLVAKTKGDPRVLAGYIREAVRDVDANQPVHDLKTMDSLIADSLGPQRFATTLLAVFAGLAILLAAIGLYGLMSYNVTQRTSEIGIRIALGAQRGEVLRMLLRQGTKLALAGVAAGIVIGLILTRLMQSLLYGVSAADPISFAGAAVLLALVALVACWIPARRAMRVDPMVALRYE